MVKNSKKMQDAEKANIPVVSEDFFEAIQTEPALAAIPKHNLVSWGTKKNTSVEKKSKRVATDVPDAPPKTKKLASSSGETLKYRTRREADDLEILHVLRPLIICQNSSFPEDLLSIGSYLINVCQSSPAFYELQAILKSNVKYLYQSLESLSRVSTHDLLVVFLSACFVLQRHE